MLSPSASPVPAYTQLELFCTTYGAFGPLTGSCPPAYCTPMSCCSGRLRKGSRHRMVVVGPCTGSIVRSLQPTITRSAAPVSGDGSNRTCQYTASAPKNPRWMPASRACWTPSYIGFDQNPSWPTDRNTLLSSSRALFSCVSTLVEYFTS